MWCLLRDKRWIICSCHTRELEWILLFMIGNGGRGEGEGWEKKEEWREGDNDFCRFTCTMHWLSFTTLFLSLSLPLPLSPPLCSPLSLSPSVLLLTKYRWHSHLRKRDKNGSTPFAPSSCPYHYNKRLVQYRDHQSWSKWLQYLSSCGMWHYHHAE